jgi:hypothetical protein
MFTNRFLSIQVISRPKLVGIGEHWGVQLLDGRVAHYSLERGLEVTNRQEFAQRREITVRREVPHFRNAEVMARLRYAALQPRPYHATQWNCEIFANWLVGEKPESQQVNGWALLTFVVGGLALAAALTK